MAVGWDQKVTEFNDVEGREYGDPKEWPMFHSDDITCADIKLGEGVATATYSGELIFWKLETGQPYRRYNVANPARFIELKHNSTDKAEQFFGDGYDYHVSISRFVRKSVWDRIQEMSKTDYLPNMKKNDDLSFKEAKSALVQTAIPALPLSVQALLFLQTRPMTKEHGT